MQPIFLWKRAFQVGCHFMFRYLFLFYGFKQCCKALKKGLFYDVNGVYLGLFAVWPFCMIYKEINYNMCLIILPRASYPLKFPPNSKISKFNAQDVDVNYKTIPIHVYILNLSPYCILVAWIMNTWKIMRHKRIHYGRWETIHYIAPLIMLFSIFVWENLWKMNRNMKI